MRPEFFVMNDEKVRLIIKGISGSPENPDLYVLILGEQGHHQGFPEVMGFYEAQSIAFSLEGCEPTVPFAHDLIYRMAKHYKVEIVEVLIKDFVNAAYQVEIMCFDGKEYAVFPARLSDAVAIALRFKSPVFVTREVLIKTGICISPDTKNILERYSLEELEVKMHDSAKNEDYETAITIRNEIKNRKHN